MKEKKKAPRKGMISVKTQTESEVDSKFSRGDLVYHRASGTPGVIKKVTRKCTKHSVMKHIATNAGVNGVWMDDCELEFSGYYVVSTDFDEETKVPEYLLTGREDEL